MPPLLEGTVDPRRLTIVEGPLKVASDRHVDANHAWPPRHGCPPDRPHDRQCERVAEFVGELHSSPYIVTDPMTPKTPSTTIASTTGISLTVRDLAAVANHGVVIMVAEAPTNDTVPSPACAVSVAVAVTISSFADTTAVRAVLRPLALIAPNRWADWPPFFAMVDF